ncbi:MAG: DUF86 domain-containing protein [Planctomycetaceae bacterium]
MPGRRRHAGRIAATHSRTGACGGGRSIRDDRQRILDILEAIDRIAAKATVTREAFAKDELLQVWVVHHLRIIGEAARAISLETQATIANVPWRQIIGMRNTLVHQYFGVDIDIVWSVLQDDLNPLRSAIQSWLSQQP